MNLGQYSKFIVAIVGAVVSYLVAHYGSQDWVNAVVLAATAIGVYSVPNVPAKKV